MSKVSRLLKLEQWTYLPYLPVGTNVGDIGIWDVGSRERLAVRAFSVWDISACSMSPQVCPSLLWDYITFCYLLIIEICCRSIVSSLLASWS